MKGSPFAMLRDASPVSRLFIHRSVGTTYGINPPIIEQQLAK